MPGKLFLVATPIGNLEDISVRALNTLKEADIIAAEDTRQSRKLLCHFGIQKFLLSYHEHNKRKMGEELINLLAAGENIALICDAGTPGISDPGADIAARAISEGFQVIAIPGASALLTALAASGLPSNRFAFEGFLPREKSSRRKALNAIRDEERTLVFYESPHRLLATLRDMAELLGSRKMVIGRELTKIYEEYIRGDINFCLEHFTNTPPKGEFTIVVEGAPPKAAPNHSQEDLANQMAELMADGLSRKEASKELGHLLGLPAKMLYALSLEPQENKSEDKSEKQE